MNVSHNVTLSKKSLSQCHTSIGCEPPKTSFLEKLSRRYLSKSCEVQLMWQSLQDVAVSHRNGFRFIQSMHYLWYNDTESVSIPQCSSRFNLNWKVVKHKGIVWLKKETSVIVRLPSCFSKSVSLSFCSGKQDEIFFKNIWGPNHNGHRWLLIIIKITRRRGRRI